MHIIHIGNLDIFPSNITEKKGKILKEKKRRFKCMIGQLEIL